MWTYVNVNAEEVALVMRKGVYQSVLVQGSHWVFNATVERYSRLRPFEPAMELNLLLQDEQLANLLQVVDVADQELALVYEDSRLVKVLTAGRYAFWKSPKNYRFVQVSMAGYQIDPQVNQAALENPLMQLYVRTYQVESHEQAVLVVNGKVEAMLAPGSYHYWRNATAISVLRVDMRVQQMEISGQEILTADKAALRLNVWAQYQVTDIRLAVLGSRDYDKQLYLVLQLAVRDYVASLSLDELLQKRDHIGKWVLAQVAGDAARLGVALVSVGIRDIILPGDMKDIMNQVLMAEKKAQANLIMRREETASTRSLLNTARLMEDNPILWKLKEMEYIERIAERISSLNLSGGDALLDQLRRLFVVPSK